jgi:hypothetical protein
MHTKVQSENLKDTYHLEDTGIGVRVILEYVLGK